MSHQTNTVALRFVAFALAMSGAIVGILAPLLLFHLGIRVLEIAPGIDVTWVVFPAAAIIDWIIAYFLWRKAKPPASRDGPVVG